MPSYQGPPAFPWIPRAERAFKPFRAWLPRGEGSSLREYIAGDHAAITGTAAWGAGSYGRCFQGNGSSYGVSAAFASTDTLSLTVAHISGASTFRGLLGWGASNNQGLLYSGTRLDLIDSTTTMRFSASLSTPTTAWRVITLTLASHANGSAASFWADGVQASTGALTASLSPATQLWIGAIRGGSNPWQAGIGPVYFHNRVLADHEVRKLHADMWRILQDHRVPIPKRMLMVSWPFSGAGATAGPAGSGALAHDWAATGAGVADPASGLGSFVHDWAFEGAGSQAAAEGSGEILSGWILSGEGVLDVATGEGELAFDWPFSGSGATAEASGSGAIGAAWYFAGAGLAGEASGSGILDWPWTFSGIGVCARPEGDGVFDWEPPPIVLPDPRRCVVTRVGGDPARSEARRK